MTTFCANCGRPRDETARFCGGCGAQLSDSAASADHPRTADTQLPLAWADAAPAVDAADTADVADAAPVAGAVPAADAVPVAGAVPPVDATRMDLAADATRVEPLDGSPDPFASWYRPARSDTPQAGFGPEEPGAGAGERWQPTQPARAAPAAATPPFPPFPPIAPVPPPRGPQRGGRRGGLIIAAAAVVVIAGAGGAYAWADRGTGPHPAAGPAPTPSVTATASSPAASPASSPSAKPTPTPAPTLSLVSIAPGVTSSAVQPAVETLLSYYFQGINTHDYAEYTATLDPAEQAKQSPSSFAAGYSSTTDSGMTLTALAASDSGGQTATVTFTSHQLATQSVDKSTCNDWTLDLFLVAQGSGYRIGFAPAGYQPKYTDC